MKEVFISYESSNQKAADNLVAALEDKGHHCWIATRNVPKGDPYDDHIPKAIAECSLVVMLFSKASLNSPHVKKELRIAVKHGKRIIPFMLEEVELREAFEYHIESNNRISADKNWNKAVEVLLHSMESTDVETTKVNKQEKLKKQIVADPHSEYIHCPYCGCTTLKEANVIISSDMEYTQKDKINISFGTFLTKISVVYTLIAFIVLSVIIVTWIASLFGISLSNDMKPTEVPLLLVFFLVVLALILPVNMMTSNIENLNNLISAVKHSRLKYWSVKCAQCEKKFFYLIPQKDELIDHAIQYLDNTSPKKGKTK